MLKPSEVFGALLRILGIYFLCGATFDILILILKYMGVPTGSPYPLSADWIGGAWRLVVGLIILISATYIVKFFYKAETSLEKTFS